MPWYHVAATFFGGMFLANFAPHFIAGVSGLPFYNPFGKPPFRGLASPAINVVYALCNLAVAYVLLVAVATFELRQGLHVASAGSGFALASIGIARSAARLRGQSAPAPLVR